MRDNVDRRARQACRPPRRLRSVHERAASERCGGRRDRPARAASLRARGWPRTIRRSAAARRTARRSVASPRARCSRRRRPQPSRVEAYGARWLAGARAHWPRPVASLREWQPREARSPRVRFDLPTEHEPRDASQARRPSRGRTIDEGAERERRGSLLPLATLALRRLLGRRFVEWLQRKPTSGLAQLGIIAGGHEDDRPRAVHECTDVLVFSDAEWAELDCFPCRRRATQSASSAAPRQTRRVLA